MNKTNLPILAIACLLTFNAQAADNKFYGNQIIVKFKDSGKARVMNAGAMQALSNTAQSKLAYKRTTGSGARVLFLDQESSPQAMEEMVARLSQRDDIEYAEVDYKRYPAAFPADAPNDTNFVDGRQWYLQDNSAIENRGAINAEAVWPELTGNGVTIAVVDTGITQHPDLDLGGNIIAGYDFISLDPDGTASTDGDGTNGRDNDARDSGDLVTTSEKDNIPAFRDDDACSASIGGKSSWHGTLVTGVLGARTDNNEGIAGVAPNATILVSRALGKCGGYNSDLMDAIRWSAGLTVNGVPANTNPAKIINLSLGGGGACSQTEQDAISAVTAAGAVVVVAAGNEGADSVSSAPGNCINTINVGATTRKGGETGYTNAGEEVDLSAPGGNNPTASEPLTEIYTTSQNKSIGFVTNNNNAIYTETQGTSFSAPLVSGVIALMLEKKSDLTPQQIYGTLLANVTAFPSGTTTAQGGDAARDCTTNNCGAGILNAKAVFDALDSNNIVSRNFPNKESKPLQTTTPPTTTPNRSGSGSDKNIGIYALLFGGGSMNVYVLFLLGLLSLRKTKRPLE